jgi:phosphoenolpyruvate carboxykinase (ATP)
MPATTPDLQAVEILANPTQDELRALALRHTPAMRETAFGGLNKVASHNKNRVAGWTYVIAPPERADEYSAKTIAPADAQRLIEHQARYIENAGTLIRLDGYLGVGPRATPAQWFYTLEGANIAGMQEVLAFSRARVEGAGAEKPFAPVLTVTYTPGCSAPDMPGGQAIVVDLENFRTYILGPDYFGESKKAALRMLNDYLYEQGGLVMHAGAKVIEVDGRRLTMAVMGLSGTGKTTTTFAKHGEGTQPLQDDMVTLWPKGELSVTEDGCFAKTGGLTAESEPDIFLGSTRREAWLENVYQDGQGNVDFSKAALTPAEAANLREVLLSAGADAANLDDFIAGKVSPKDLVDELGVARDGWDFAVWTQNGRSIFPLSAIPNAADPLTVPPVASIGILNRDEGPDAATPGIVRFTNARQAAGYFMLGETSKTSAAGKERGKTRSPFTQPFFPRSAGKQAQRFDDLVETLPSVQMWMMNTGYVGGDDRAVTAGKALKVKIRHSTAMVNALLHDRCKWVIDPDFGYEVIDVTAPENKELLDLVPAEILQPRLFFERNGRMDDYRGWVALLHKDRRVYLDKHKVAADIIAAVCP